MDEPREGCVLGQRKNASRSAGERRECWARSRTPTQKPDQDRRSSRRAFQSEPAMPSATFSGEAAMCIISARRGWCPAPCATTSRRRQRPKNRSLARSERRIWMPVTPCRLHRRIWASEQAFGPWAKTSSVSLPKRPCFRYLPDPFRNPSVIREMRWKFRGLTA
jgi:hypothetical protein